MLEDKSIGEAVNSYVKSLEEEQKSDSLIENKRADKRGMSLPGFARIADFVKIAIGLICLGEEVNVKTDPGSYKISVYGSGLGMAIGKNGKNMQALEFITNLIGKRKKLIERSVTIDIEDYKKKKLEKIERVAKSMARKAIKEGRKIVLKPMCSHERKIVHSVLAEFKEVRTESKNNEPYRRIVIYPVGGKS
jgi:spoIIIJ-associated protein